MQLDRTHVTIRVRTLSEIGDLALLMIRRYPHAFFHAFFLGASGWILANALLLGGLSAVFTGESIFSGDSGDERFRYLFWVMTLVFLQTPLAGVLTTYTLGQAIFEQEPSLRKAFREVRSLFWPLFWTLGVKRLAIPAMMVVAVRWNQPAHPFYDVLLPIFFILAAALIRSNRPFVAEMILLERCPIRSKREGVITLRRRSKALHSPLASELGGRFLTVSMTLTALLFCLYFALVWVRGIAVGVWDADALAMHVFFPLSLWLIASFSVVVRLLGYLDARIRLEGWEVELALRAEAIRQFGEDFMEVPLNEVRQPGRKPVGKTSTTVLVLIGLATLFSPLGNSRADAAKRIGVLPLADAPVVADSAWFDSQSDSLRPIELDDTQVETKNRDSRWVPQPAKAKTQASAGSAAGNNTSSWGGISLWNLAGWGLLLCLIAVAVGGLMYLFGNSSFDFRTDPLGQSLVHHRRLDEQTKQRIAELPAELRDTDINPRTELERLMQLGDFDRAIIFLYGHQLLMLDRAGWLRLSRWKTNNQYVRETRQSHPRVGEHLGHIASEFERSYFGKHRITREIFDSLWQENLQVEEIVSTGGGTSS